MITYYNVYLRAIISHHSIDQTGIYRASITTKKPMIGWSRRILLEARELKNLELKLKLPETHVQPAGIRRERGRGRAGGENWGKLIGKSYIIYYS